MVVDNSEKSGLQIHANQKFGRWRTVRLIARGGNGQVWLAEDESQKQVAIKFLAKNRPIAYGRFKDEIAVLQKVTGVPGILPILHANLPATLDDARPWYAMPLGVPIDDWARHATPRERVEAIAAAAKTMAALHERQIAHRDIKPGNLVMFDNLCHVVDFGLVHHPEKTALTGYKEHIGPLWTMAAEVRRNGRNADPFPADVFSLAKTLWINKLEPPVLPDGGGMDLEVARLSVHEPGCIELHTGSWNIVKPISLTLETFPGDAQWNYLRLEAAKLDPVDISGGGLNEDDAEFDDENEQAEEEEQDGEYTLRERTNEKLTEIDEHTYASRACWDENRYEGEKLPDSARVVVRWFGGAFVIFQKTSFYNLAHGKLDAYDGRHNRMDAEQFRSHIQELRNAVQEKGIDLRTRRIRERDTVREYYKDTLRHGR